MNRKMPRIRAVFMCMAVALFLSGGCTLASQIDIHVAVSGANSIVTQNSCGVQYQEPLYPFTYAELAKRHVQEVVIIHAELKELPKASEEKNKSSREDKFFWSQDVLRVPAFYYDTIKDERAQGMRPYKSGTGFVFDAWGTKAVIVTNSHMQSNSGNITVTMFNKKEYLARVVYASNDPKFDVAFLLVEKKNPSDPNEIFVPAAIGDSDKVLPGDAAMSVGHPYNLHYSVHGGNIASVRHSIKLAGDSFLQLNISTYPGNSGSPAYNMCGEAIALIFGIELDRTNEQLTTIGWSIPMNMIKEVYSKEVKPKL